MRGNSSQQVPMLSILTPEELVPDGSPAPADQGDRRPSARRVVASLRRDVREQRASEHPARAFAQGAAYDRAVFDSQRAPAVRAAAVQPALQVVPGHGRGDPGLRSPPASARTASACSATRWHRVSSSAVLAEAERRRCSPTSISRWTGRCSRRGLVEELPAPSDATDHRTHSGSGGTQPGCGLSRPAATQRHPVNPRPIRRR